jgi:uncharacterized iron-regulated membrane protein
MRLIDLTHRWLGGVMGLVLAVLGLSGAILAHKDAWIALPHANDPQRQEIQVLAAAVERLMADPEARPQSIVFASRGFGLHRLNHGGEHGAYASQDGAVVTAWDSKWDRPEVWLFDLHHHLLAGDQGEAVAGVAALVGLGFVVTGVILWWPLRRSYQFRLWPKTLGRYSILRHHRDLGVVLAPMLALSLITGSIMVFRPVSNLVLGPGTAKAVTAALAAPKLIGVPLAEHPPWRAMLETARAHYPDAEVRILSLPRKESGLISLRLRQPQEWLPNGRTVIWFAADTGALVATRDARALPLQVQAYNALYPLHAAKVGGLAYRLAITAAGLGLGVFGTLTVWTFWFKRRRPQRARATASPA